MVFAYFEVLTFFHYSTVLIFLILTVSVKLTRAEYLSEFSFTCTVRLLPTVCQLPCRPTISTSDNQD